MRPPALPSQVSSLHLFADMSQDFCEVKNGERRVPKVLSAGVQANRMRVRQSQPPLKRRGVDRPLCPRHHRTRRGRRYPAHWEQHSLPSAWLIETFTCH